MWCGGSRRDERKKGHNYLTCRGLGSQRVLLAVEGKDAGTWERFAEQLASTTDIPRRSSKSH